MIKIGIFSQLSRVSIRMLRHYDDLGLLKPDAVDSSTGYRYYSFDQLYEANRIRALRDMGFGLSAIAEILKQYQDSKALEAFLLNELEKTIRQEQEARSRAKLINTALKGLREDDCSMLYNVTLKTIPERYVASLRKIIPTFDDEGDLWDQMAEETNHALQLSDPCYPITIYHDGEYREKDIDAEIQVTVDGEYEDTDNVFFKTVEAIEVASTVYKGSYNQSYAAHEAVANWVEENGYDYAGPIINIYHVSPGHDPNPDNWVTEVCCPIKKK